MLTANSRHSNNSPRHTQNKSSNGRRRPKKILRPVSVIAAIFVTAAALALHAATHQSHPSMPNQMVLIGISTVICTLFACWQSDVFAGLATGIIVGAVSFPVVGHFWNNPVIFGILGVCVIWAITAITMPALAKNVLAAGAASVACVALRFSTEHAEYLHTSAQQLLYPMFFALPIAAIWVSDRSKRSDYSPLMLWILIPYVGSLLLAQSVSHNYNLVFPALSVLAGCGFSRLLPVLTGDSALPTARYGLAIIALFILGLMSWFAAPVNTISATDYQRNSVTAVTAPILLPHLTLVSRTPRTAKGTSRPSGSAQFNKKTKIISNVSHTAKHSRMPIAPTKKLFTKRIGIRIAGRSAVEVTTKSVRPNLYYRKWGRMVRRSKWAIKWERAHPNIAH